MKKLFLLLLLIPGTCRPSADFPVPVIHENSLLLQNKASVVSYNPSHKQADWVFYSLEKNELRSCVDRGGIFRPDPRLKTDDSAQLGDFKNSGFDRGHLKPAADNRWNREAMNESFLLSNVSPQDPVFNRGIWAKLENLVRAWAKNNGGLWVSTGPLLNGSLRTIGADRVSVPEFFFKVLATKIGEKHEAIAFLLPTSAHGNLTQYEMTVRNLEAVSGLDFLSGLSDEDEAESSFHSERWNLNADFTYYPCTPGFLPAPLESENSHFRLFPL